MVTSAFPSDVSAEQLEEDSHSDVDMLAEGGEAEASQPTIEPQPDQPDQPNQPDLTDTA